MLSKILYSAAFFFLLSACASTRTTLDANSAYSQHQYASHDVNVVWKSEQTGTDIRIKGAITNTRQDSPYQGFELTATLLDENGKTLAQKMYAVAPGPLVGTQDFNMDIPLENKEQLQRIKFFYKYGIQDDHFTGDFESLP